MDDLLFKGILGVGVLGTVKRLGMRKMDGAGVLGWIQKLAERIEAVEVVKDGELNHIGLGVSREVGGSVEEFGGGGWRDEGEGHVCEY